MSDTPIADALRDIPKNQARVEGAVSQEAGGEVRGSIEREKNGKAFGVEAGFSQKKGGRVAGFFSWMFK